MAKEIEVFVPGLQNTAGWASLSREQQDWLLEHTGTAVQNFRQAGLKQIQGCIAISKVHDYLEDKPLNFTNWAISVFPHSASTAFNYLKRYRELRGAISDEAMQFLAEKGIQAAAGVETKRVLSAVKQLPPPKGNDPKTLEKWAANVGTQIMKGRAQSKKGTRRMDAREAMQTWITAGLHLLKQTRLNTSAEQRDWITIAVGYLLELRGITGTVDTKRVPVPDSFMPKRGRPPKKMRKAA